MLKTIRSREAAMPFIMLTVFIDMVSVGLIVPVIPALVGSFTSSNADQTHWFTLIVVGFGVANFLASPLLGALSDRYGRRPVLLLGFFGFSISFFGTVLADSLLSLLVVRVAAGALQANQAIANAYVADITPPELRAKRFGMLGAMFGLGFIVGPVVGGLLGAIDLKLPFLAAGVMALLNLLYGYFVLPESLPVVQRHGLRWRALNPLTSLRALAGLKGVGALVGVVAFSGLAQFVLYSTWVLYNTFKFGWGPLENGWSLAVVGVMSVLVQGVLMGQLLRKFSVQRLAVMGLVSSSLAYLLFGAATQGWMMYVVIVANLLGSTVAASVQSLISAAASSQHQGQTMGAVSSLNSLMAVIAPMLGLPLLGLVAHLPVGDWRMGAPFYFCAALQAASLGLAVLHFRRHQRATR